MDGFSENDVLSGLLSSRIALRLISSPGFRHERAICHNRSNEDRVPDVDHLAAAIALMSAVAKLRRDPKVVRVIRGTTRVPMRYVSPLAACEVAGALGLLAGMWWPPVGIVAGAGLMLYVVGAVIAHLLSGTRQASVRRSSCSSSCQPRSPRGY